MSFMGTFKSLRQWLNMKYKGIQRKSVSQAMKLITNEGEGAWKLLNKNKEGKGVL